MFGLRWKLPGPDQRPGGNRRNRGICQTAMKAYAWLNFAAAHGGPVVQVEVGRLKDTLRKQMTARQIAEGQRLAAELQNRIESAKPE